MVTLTHGSVSETVAIAAGKQTLTFGSLGISVETDATATDGAAMNGTNLTVDAGSGTFLVSSSGDYAGNDQITITGV